MDDRMENVVTVLKEMTEKALEDGVITEDERALLKNVFEDLKKTNVWIGDAFDQGIIDLTNIRIKNLFVRIYDSAKKKALEDGVITDDEQALLDQLGKSLGIEDKTQ